MTSCVSIRCTHALQDDRLREAVKQFNGKNWKKVAEIMGNNKTDVQCLHRWQKVLNPVLVKGPWTAEEDGKVVDLVERYGPKKWSLVAQHLPGRIGKQCRERYVLGIYLRRACVCASRWG